MPTDKLQILTPIVTSVNGQTGDVDARPDWNQNDSTAPDYVKNRPFYTGGPVETVIIEERTESFSDSGMGWYSTSFQLEFSATIGETYKVYWDGAAYECTCVECNGSPVIGNLSIPGQGPDTGEPFVITVIDTSVYVYAADTSASHTISISGFVQEVVKIDRKYLPTPFKPEGNSYLTFSSPNSFTLAVNDATKHWDGTLEYFASNKTWATWDGTITLSAVYNDGDYVLYLRGTGNTVITGSRSNYKWVLTGTDISCIGNIENLLDYETVQSGVYPTMATNCYRNMFSGCTSLTQAPALPATTLANDCYYNMFYGCTSLTQAPALPATTLVDGCYYSMFYGCTSLTQAPALPATTLANYCYSQMFCGCTSLTQAPVLPIITLANQCYDGMFAGCTSLTKAPALPATTLANNCYHFMFLNCTSLTQAPALPATTLANQCYNGMFSGCTSLKLSSTQTGEYTQEYRIPTTGTGTTATDALVDMFTSTGGTFTGTPEINTTYYISSDNMVVRETDIATLREYVESMIDSPFKPSGNSYLMFSSPSSFTLKVNGATKHWDGTLEYFAFDNTWSTWDGTTTLSSVDNDGEHVLYLRGTGNTQITGFYQIPRFSWVLTGSDIKCVGNIENLLDYETVESGAHPTMADWCYHYMFNGCKSLTQAPDLPATTLASYCYSSMFYSCTSLTQAPALPATTLANYCYLNMFNGCKSLTKAPALSATTLADYCYQDMFGNCTSLTQTPALPATTLALSCYAGMFNGCKSLTQAPVLPATTLATSCYENMFNGCTSLTQTPALPATTLAYNCYYRMFYGCTSLTKAPALPATTLADGCYRSMFQGCTSLTQTPSLPATILATNCYSYMFCDCTGLKLSSSKTDEYTQEYRIPSSGTGTTATDALSNMFTNTGGTFIGAPSINTTYYLSTDNMIVRDTDVATLNGYVGSMIDAAIGNAIGGSY